MVGTVESLRETVGVERVVLVGASVGANAVVKADATDAGDGYPEPTDVGDRPLSEPFSGSVDT